MELRDYVNLFLWAFFRPAKEKYFYYWLNSGMHAKAAFSKTKNTSYKICKMTVYSERKGEDGTTAGS